MPLPEHYRMTRAVRLPAPLAERVDCFRAEAGIPTTEAAIAELVRIALDARDSLAEFERLVPPG